MILNYIVKNNNNLSINQILLQELNFSNRLLHKLIISNHIYINNKNVDTRNIPIPGDVINIDLNFNETSENIVPTEINLDIIYEDDGLLVLNKQPGIPIHPSILHYEDSLSNGVQFYYNKIGLKSKIRPVNRLDRNTSGLVVFAKNEYIQECLIRQMKANMFHKEYIAICEGIFNDKKGTINLPIARKENSIIERCISDNGQEAITDYEIIENVTNKNFSIVKCKLLTGRTHQIRLHMSHIGHPIIGDSLYGNSSSLINRQALHSYKISFIHPITNKRLCFTADLPEDIESLKH